MENGKDLNNCMIDFGSSNTVMPFKVMKEIGLKVYIVQVIFCVMDQREVTFIGTINVLPYRLATYPSKELTMNFLVVGIPPQYGMLL